MRRSILFIILICIIIPNIWAQDTISKKDWKKQRRSHLLEDRPWNIEVPLWLPGFSGSFAHGNIVFEGEDGIDHEQPIEPPPGWRFGRNNIKAF